MIDPRALAALQEAARIIEAEVPEPSPDEIQASAAAHRLADQERKRRPTPEECAKAWKAHNGRLRRRRQLTVASFADAMGVLNRGIGTGAGDAPRDMGSRSKRTGKTAEEKALEKVRLTRDLLLPGESLQAAVLAWPLPETFYDDLPPLCGVEEELLADPRPYEPPPEREPEVGHVRAEGYLMPGMRREEGGLHG